MSCFLGIDTSNYTTSVALSSDFHILANLKCPVEVAAGQRGVRQSDAVFSHIKNLPTVMQRLGAHSDIAAVGYSARPRDVEGSYMPCFLPGKALAESVAALLGVPCYPLSHQAGHIAAAVYASKGRETLGDRFIAFHVSGGTTEMLLVKRREGSAVLDITKIGGTEDLTAGQAIDRVGVRLGLSFPCGPEMERLSLDKKLPKTRPCVRGMQCHLSGLENQAEKMQKDGRPASEISAYVLTYIRDTLDVLAAEARKIHPDIPLLFAGGVMSCRMLQDHFLKKYGALFAEPAFSSDNAAGIALLCEELYRNEHG